MSGWLSVVDLRDEVIVHLRAIPGVSQVEPEDGNERGIVVRGSASNAGQVVSVLVNIENLYSEYCRRPERVDLLIQQFIAPVWNMINAGPQSEVTSQSWPVAARQVYLRLERTDRRAAHIAGTNGLMTPLFRPWLIQGVYCGVVFDTETSMVTVCERHLQQWQIDEATVFATAEENLRALTLRGPGFQRHEGMYVMNCRDGYAASRLLAPGALRRHLPSFLQRNRMVVAVPRRDLLLAIPSHRDDLAVGLIQHITHETSPYGLTRRVFLWNGDEVTPIQPSAINPLTA